MVCSHSRRPDLWGREVRCEDGDLRWVGLGIAPDPWARLRVRFCFQRPWSCVSDRGKGEGSQMGGSRIQPKPTAVTFRTLVPEQPLVSVERFIRS